MGSNKVPCRCLSPLGSRISSLESASFARTWNFQIRGNKTDGNKRSVGNWIIVGDRPCLPPPPPKKKEVLLGIDKCRDQRSDKDVGLYSRGKTVIARVNLRASAIPGNKGALAASTLPARYSPRFFSSAKSTFSAALCTESRRKEGKEKTRAEREEMGKGNREKRERRTKMSFNRLEPIDEIGETYVDQFVEGNERKMSSRNIENRWMIWWLKLLNKIRREQKRKNWKREKKWGKEIKKKRGKIGETSFNRLE